MKTISRFVIPGVLSVLMVGGFAPSSAQAEDIGSYVHTFNISAYYSPCEGQSRYATGSYEGDIRLNGNGTNGADGTPVYPGMIAAPKTYAFGTKMSIPGIGITAVHDRGGAIVPAGDRGQAHDRLDVWMGWCDEGLTSALNWGMKTVDVTVYGVEDPVEEAVYVEVFSYTEAIVKNVVLAPQLFEKDIWYLSTGEDVERLQVMLTELGFYQGEISGYYGDDTREAVYQFQLSNSIVDSWDDLGAGHTGVNTRKMLDLAISRFREEQESEHLQRYQKGLVLLQSYPDLAKNQVLFHRDLTVGAVGEDVKQLQSELVALGYLRLQPTGYYGEVTEHAVLKFQQKQGIVMDVTQEGAGTFGPQTRTVMNALLENRTRTLSYIAVIRSEREEVNAAPTPSDDPNDFVRTMTFGDRGKDVKALQSLLKQMGFFKGSLITEFYGEQTGQAIRAFQLINQLIVTEMDAHAGSVDEATRTLLNSLT